MTARILCALLPVMAAAPPCRAGDLAGLPDVKPLPAMEVVPLPDHQASFRYRGEELARAWFAPDLDRPFIFPLRLPGEARSLTRMGHPHDPDSHSHHNSLWLSHNDIDGVNFWADTRRAGTGRVVARHADAFHESDASAAMTLAIQWIRHDSGEPLLDESRTITAFPPDDRGWLLTIESTFTPAGDRAVTLNPTPFGLIGVRMAKSIGVHDGGGRILNSHGAVNEEPVFRKPARWADYSGRLTDSSAAGVTLLDDPRNPNHPAPFHVRNDGWMGACLTLNAPITVTKDRPLATRYGLWIHHGAPDTSAADAVWQEFAQPKDPPSPQ